ncbi:MAG: TadE/TadG family type IV pilus assembly protein [Bacillota bacterium]
MTELGRAGDRRGTVAVEFALVSTLLLFLLFIIIDLGLALHVRLVLGAAAREGARQAAVDGGASARAMQRVLDYLYMAGIGPEDAEISFMPAAASYGTPVTVTVSYHYRFTVPLVQAVLGPLVHLQGTAVTRSERLR